VKPLVSVVIPTCRRPLLLRRCLTALAAQTLAPANFEVVVVDDGRDPATRSIVEQFARDHRAMTIHVLMPPPGARGPAAARNAGWRAAWSSRIAFTDDDTIPARDWLAEGLAALTGDVLAAWGHVVVPISREPTDYERTVKRMEGAPFLTANCFVRRSALEQVGGFDERFRRAWREDSDLHFSLLRLGIVKPAPRAIVCHPVRQVPWGVSLGQQKNNLFDALLFKKHRSLYRSRIRPVPPLGHYATVIAGLFALGAAVTGQPLLAWYAAGLWLALTAMFLWRRIADTRITPVRFVEMALTSVAIPWLAVFWRLAGAVRFRVWFA